MLKYIIKRVLLMIPTFFATTFLVFLILQVAPGGPFQRAVDQIKNKGKGGGGESGGGRSSVTGSETLPPEVLDKLKRQFGLDMPLPFRYLSWLGLYPHTVYERELTLNEPFRETIEFIINEADNKKILLQRWVKLEGTPLNPTVKATGIGSDFKFNDKYQVLPDDPNTILNWKNNTDWKVTPIKGTEKYQIKRTAFSGILSGDLGTSYSKDKKVSALIYERLPISCYFGIISLLLTYLICIPLGIRKAVNHGSSFDLISSAIIFIAYAIPGFALGGLLLTLFGGGSFLNWFPLGNFHSSQEIWNNLSFFGKALDLLHHTFLPVLCYMIGSFTTLTVLMKNSLLDNLMQDYVRTAYAKGLSSRDAIYKHALRNSLIPIATGFGHIIGFFLAGSFLIEKAFNIDGIGKLTYESLVNSDYPITLGFLVINIILLQLGNLISDLLYVAIDPRIKFD